MDLLSFIAKIVETLAWPSVVVAGYWAFKDQMPSAIARLEEIALPGGAKAKFVRALDEARSEKESISSKATIASESLLPLDPSLLELANSYPEAAILESYKKLEVVLIEIRAKLDLPPRSNLNVVIRKLVEREFIESSVAKLFDIFRSARNSAAHAQRDERITPGEALEFISQSQFLFSIFDDVNKKL